MYYVMLDLSLAMRIRKMYQDTMPETRAWNNNPYSGTTAGKGLYVS